jgi:hypothetical protein
MGAACGGIGGARSMGAACGGIGGARSIGAACGGIAGARSWRLEKAPAWPAMLQHATNAITLDFIRKLLFVCPWF